MPVVEDLLQNTVALPIVRAKILNGWCPESPMYLFIFYMLWLGSRDSLLVRAPDSWSKGCQFESRQERRRIFVSKVNFVCWLLFGVRSTPVLPQWHIKDPGHSAKSAAGRLHLNTHIHLTQRSRGVLTMLPSRHSVGTYPETSSHATCQGTIGHRRLYLLSHCGLILAYRVEWVCAK